jgi:hypothetical protein
VIYRYKFCKEPNPHLSKIPGLTIWIFFDRILRYKERKDMITLNITPEQLEAIKIAFAEISNSGEWAEYYNEEQVENVYSAADYFTNLNPS